MTPGRRWRGIAPAQFNDGVLYLPAMVEIQPRERDWALPNMAEILARVDDDRPHGGDETYGRLLCLRCMAINARAGKTPCPVWMYLRRHKGLLLFCHIGSRHVHPEHMPESAEHKALVRREVRTCERVGASVETEVWTARGRRRADFIAAGPEVILAGEVQLTRVPRQSIAQRHRDLTRDGKRALWTTDSTQPDFLDGVPRLVIPALTGWQQVLRDPESAIVAGWWLMEYQRCGWADAWNGDRPRCPRTRSLRPCGRIHAYPTRNATTRTYRPTSGPVMQIGMGNRPHLDFVVGGILMGDWLPYKRRVSTGSQFEWIPARDYPHVVEDRGGEDPKDAERSPGIRHETIASAERTCETRTDDRGQTTIIDMKPAFPRQPGPTPTQAGDGAAVPLQHRAADVPRTAGWADHPRWATAPRCTTCGQPLIHPKSIQLGACARHPAPGW